MRIQRFIEDLVSRGLAVMIEEPHYNGIPDNHKIRITLFRGDLEIMAVEAGELDVALGSALRMIGVGFSVAERDKRCYDEG